MRKRLVLSTVVVVFFAVVGLGIPISLLIRHVGHQSAVSRLQTEAQAVAVSFSDDLLSNKAITQQDLAAVLPTNDRIRLRLADGTELIDGQRARFAHELSVTVEGPAESQFTLATSGEGVEHRVKDALILLVFAGLGVVLAAGVLAWWIARRLTAPLAKVAAAADNMGTGDFSTKAPHWGLPEVDAVADALNRSADRINELVQAERDFTSNASHQLRSGLTSLRLRLETLALTHHEDVREDAVLALRQAEATRYDLVRLVRHHVARIEPVARRDGRTVSITSDGDVEMVGSPGAVGEALDVLLSNALAHGMGDVEIDITAVNGSHAVVVADDGAGIAEDSLTTLFERRPNADGHGIGLALARTLVEAEGGRLELINPRPAVFRLLLPSNPGA
jgi:signal transduction histidine kinase